MKFISPKISKYLDTVIINESIFKFTNFIFRKEKSYEKIF